MSNQILAYKQGIKKSDFIREIKYHTKMDNFQHVGYGEGESKGCAIGCSLQSINKLKGVQLSRSDHRRMEADLGIPYWLARLEDKIFEGLPLEESKKWPLEFSMSIKVGVDLNTIRNQVLIFIVNSTLSCFDNKKYKNIVKIINDLTKELKKKVLNKEKLLTIRKAAAAADAADAADASYAAAAAAAAYAAAAADAADAADAAYAAYAAAAADAAYAAAYAAARYNFYINLSKEVIRLIKGLKPNE